MRAVAVSYRAMKIAALIGALFVAVPRSNAQIQVELKLPRLQFIAYEPVIATLGITNLAGRDVDLHDADGESWFGFEITGAEGQPIAPVRPTSEQPPLRIEAGKKVTRKINLTPLYQVHDFGTYHVRAHIYFSDVSKFFYSQTKVFQVTDARPIWQKTVGIPEGTPGSGAVRTYSLLTNRFPDHTSLYVRVEDKDTAVVYATYSLGKILSFDDPQAELDRANRLHVLHCAAPRTWSYSMIGLNGELLAHSSFMETKSRPRLLRASAGDVTVTGGIADTPTAAPGRNVPKLSDRPADLPKD